MPTGNVDYHAPTPERARPSSSIEILADRVRRVAFAWERQDEDAARTELRTLALEAELLAKMVQLPFPSSPYRRQMVAATREATERASC
jgi:hypothetical protein